MTYSGLSQYGINSYHCILPKPHPSQGPILGLASKVQFPFLISLPYSSLE